MAKKKVQMKSPAEKTTTYSTRLNEDQRLHLEEAAEAAGVSASRFIRDATLRAAADVVNARTPNDLAITSLATRLADTLLNQKGSVTSMNECGEYHTIPYLFAHGDVEIGLNHEVDLPESRWHPISVSVESLSSKDIDQLIAIAESCPFTFAMALKKSLRRVNEPIPEFSVRSNPVQLLKD